VLNLGGAPSLTGFQMDRWQRERRLLALSLVAMSHPVKGARQVGTDQRGNYI
jgi:hypothetical protein